MAGVARYATVYDVAALAGVSIATVSRFFRNPDAVKPSTRELVQAAVRQLGYVPSASARGLAARRTGVLGLCVPGVDGLDESDLTAEPDVTVTVRRDDTVEAETGGRQLYVDQVMRGFEMEAWRRGFAAMTAVIRGPGRDAAVSELAGRVDALAVLSRTASDEALQHISKRLPVAVIAGPATDDTFDHIGVDNEAGMAALTDHLVQAHAYRDLAFVGGPMDSPDSAARFDGFRRACRTHGLPVPRSPHWRSDFTTAGGRRVGAELLASGKLPRAVVCANDQSAVGLLETFLAAGIDVPVTVAITGFDGIEAARLVRPRITTVAQPMTSMGRSAVDLLLQRVAGADAGVIARTLPVDVLLRESCGCSRPVGRG